LIKNVAENVRGLRVKNRPGDCVQKKVARQRDVVVPRCGRGLVLALRVLCVKRAGRVTASG